MKNILTLIDVVFNSILKGHLLLTPEDGWKILHGKFKKKKKRTSHVNNVYVVTSEHWR